MEQSRERIMNTMNIIERKLDDVAVLDLEGRFILGGASQFKRRVEAHIEGGGRKLIVNLAKLVYMDSSGLGELVSCYLSMQLAGGEIKLIHLNDRLTNLLVTTKLMTVFETFDSEAAAVSSFNTPIKVGVSST
jgi:anti-sigma B factor antagonist